MSKSMFLKKLEARLDDKNDEVVISDLYGHILETSKDQKGSRLLQDIYCLADDTDKQQVFAEIKDSGKDLMLDKFANYVIQLIFEHGLQSHKEFFAK